MDCPAITPTASPGCAMERYHLTYMRRWKSAGALNGNDSQACQQGVDAVMARGRMLVCLSPGEHAAQQPGIDEVRRRLSYPTHPLPNAHPWGP